MWSIPYYAPQLVICILSDTNVITVKQEIDYTCFDLKHRFLSLKKNEATSFKQRSLNYLK